ncbi:MAG: hypothetical protein AAGF86_07390 [Pseudomonadota bacterium]
MHQQELIADIMSEAEVDPTALWEKSERKLIELLLELAEDLLDDEHEAAAMIAAIENQQPHPHKQSFIELNYPVVKAWCTVKAAVDGGRMHSQLCH